MDAPAARSPEELARQFERDAREQFAGYAPLYARLARGVAADPALLALAATARPGQQPPLMLFAAVQYLLLRGIPDPLAAWYPRLDAAPPPRCDPLPAFRAFCLAHGDTIQDLLATRLVQTNEVRRCSALLPAFGLVAARQPGRPLALIEIGPSAGLNLLWDRYGYDYGPAGRAGDLRSPVQLGATVRGAHTPPLPRQMPAIASRLGVDLHPVDVRDPDAVRWLRALIWPGHPDRATRLMQAIALAREDPPPLVAGDAVELLPGVLAAVPAAPVLCVFHAFVMGQLQAAAREQIAQALAAASRERTLYRVALEWPEAPNPRLILSRFSGGRQQEETLLAYAQAHGEWIRWLAPSVAPAAGVAEV